ncbi:MAG: hypothetical protein AAFR67_17065, partial [Chloroflexota bacterium]
STMFMLLALVPASAHPDYVCQPSSFGYFEMCRSCQFSRDILSMSDARLAQVQIISARDVSSGWKLSFKNGTRISLKRITPGTSFVETVEQIRLEGSHGAPGVAPPPNFKIAGCYRFLEG